MIKRDGCEEEFSRAKLAAGLHRAMERTEGSRKDAWELAWAIEIYLHRRRCRFVSSAAIFEMGLKVLRRVALADAAQAMERHRSRRARRRRALRVHHGCRRVTRWEKGWVSDLARVGWGLSAATGRIIAGEVERCLLAQDALHVDRREVVDLLNEVVAAYGLADAVPVSPVGGP